MLHSLLKPFLFRLDAERAHELVAGSLRLAARVPIVPRLLRLLFTYDDPILKTSCAGLRCANPVGLAAGFDKRAVLVGPMALLGFGHIEVGTVTPRPQSGNPRPRLFRLPEDRALINRLGFNSPGMLAVARNLGGEGREVGGWSYPPRPPSPLPPPPIVGVNLGKNRDTPLDRAVEDYLAGFVALAPLADYVAVNISSPNTPGLRLLHERAALEELLGAIAAANRRLARPLFLKVSPDETPAQIEQVVQVGAESGIAGFIATNTTVARSSLHSPRATEAGGLSGRPLAAAAHDTTARIYRLVGGRLSVIGVGGIAGAEDAYARIRAGASLVQLYTGLVYEGPSVVGAINRGLAQLLRRDGFASLKEAVGTANG
ncbi:MAG TPA: quinone-dependent dihydroorotate dehydrogenase [Roseiflexaceae bacterium]|nr:quinone-dependent dihydroorotate dehydrogenase [Roseiflexaceae bacterium]